MSKIGTLNGEAPIFDTVHFDERGWRIFFKAHLTEGFSRKKLVAITLCIISRREKNWQAGIDKPSGKWYNVARGIFPRWNSSVGRAADS